MKNPSQKSLSDFKEELHKCSKCGLCQSVCPLYETTKNECSVSRGQFIMLNGVVSGKLKINKNINKYLDLCLKCNKCSQFCPSDIDVVDILLTAKHEYFQNSLEGKLYSIFESKLVFNNCLKIVKFITSLLNPKRIKSEKFDKKAVYFGGCISKLKPDVSGYVTTLLNKMDIEVLDVDFNCCGMLFLTTGNLDRFKEQIEENISKIPDDVDYLITDCSSCEWSWSQYSKYLDDEKLKKKLANIQFKNIYELIANSDIKFKSDKKRKITYHQPCHETHSDCIEKIIKNIENTEYIELENKNSCCGFASFEHPKTLQTNYPIIRKKKDTITKTKADYTLTSCVGCLLNLNLLLFFSKQKALRLISFLRDNLTIK